MSESSRARALAGKQLFRKRTRDGRVGRRRTRDKRPTAADLAEKRRPGSAHDAVDRSHARAEPSRASAVRPIARDNAARFRDAPSVARGRADRLASSFPPTKLPGGFR